LEAKDPVGEKFITGLCFMFDPNGVIDPGDNMPRLIHTPMQANLFRYILDIVCESMSGNVRQLPLVERGLDALDEDTCMERLEFDIFVNGQTKQVLYLNYCSKID
jgi:hypothetical protein